MQSAARIFQSGRTSHRRLNVHFPLLFRNSDIPLISDVPALLCWTESLQTVFSFSWISIPSWSMFRLSVKVFFMFSILLRACNTSCSGHCLTSTGNTQDLSVPVPSFTERTESTGTHTESSLLLCTAISGRDIRSNSSRVVSDSQTGTGEGSVTNDIQRLSRLLWDASDALKRL